jgi:hypothetical protein
MVSDWERLSLNKTSSVFSKRMTVTITKIGADAPPPAPTGGKTQKAGRHEPGHRSKTPSRGVLKGGKTHKAKVKIEGVRDPAKAPPTRKATLKILTDKGLERRRNRISKTVRAMPDAKVRQILQTSGMKVSPKTPPALAKAILEGGMEAGMIVSP